MTKMSETAQHLLEMHNLQVDFQTARGIVHAVRDVSFHIDRGETLAILGESGSGKSVTASAILGIVDSPPGFIRAGRILFRGDDLLQMSAEQRRQLNGRAITIIFQDPLAALNPVYSVGWQIAEALRTHGLQPGNEKREALRLLERDGIADAARRFDSYPHQFSGGQRQRVMIAMAIATRPDLLIADEATSALDVTVQAQILTLLKELQAETGMGLLLITHNLGIVADVADRVVVMQEGRVVESGPVQPVFAAPTHPYTQRLLDSVPGRHGFAVRHLAPGAIPLLEVRNLEKRYPLAAMFGAKRLANVAAVDNVSFVLHQGESLGIVGESGSGKSTLARVLLGLNVATSGTVLYRGKDMATFSKAEMFEFRRRIQVIFQDPTASLNPYMTVGSIIAEPWAIHRDVLPKDQWARRTSELLERVGLKPAHAFRYPHQFSGGQRQRIAIARALALNPEVIVCDEAVSALDVSIQAQVIELLKELGRELSLAYLFIAHDLSVVRDFTDHLLVMHRGKVVEDGETAAVFANPKDPYTRELLAATQFINAGPAPAAPQSRPA
jgi:peptide/nickel transport system ATP-binding protein